MATTELVKRQLPDQVAYKDEENAFTESQFIDKTSGDTYLGAGSSDPNGHGAVYTYSDGSTSTEMASWGSTYADPTKAGKARLLLDSETMGEIVNTLGPINIVATDFTVNGSPISGSGISKEEAIAYAIALG